MNVYEKVSRLLPPPPIWGIPNGTVEGDARKYESISSPVRLGGLTAGVIQLIFEKELPETPSSCDIFSLLALAAEPYLGLPGRASTSPAVGSQWAVPRRQSENLALSLTERQLSILGSMTEGMTYYQIARKLLLSESTIKQEVGKIFRFLGVNTRDAALDVAKSRSLI